MRPPPLGRAAPQGAGAGVRTRTYSPLALPLPAPLENVVSRLPRPRLTALGSGVLAMLAMLVTGALDALVLGGSPESYSVYGVCFLLASAACAVWVRPAELIAAPIAVPLAFAAGLFFLGDGSEGFGGRVVGLLPALSLNAGWLYGGTLLAALIALVRKGLLLLAARRAQQQ